MLPPCDRSRAAPMAPAATSPLHPEGVSRPSPPVSACTSSFGRGPASIAGFYKRRSSGALRRARRPRAGGAPGREASRSRGPDGSAPERDRGRRCRPGWERGVVTPSARLPMRLAYEHLGSSLIEPGRRPSESQPPWRGSRPERFAPLHPETGARGAAFRRVADEGCIARRGVSSSPTPRCSACSHSLYLREVRIVHHGRSPRTFSPRAYRHAALSASEILGTPRARPRSGAGGPPRAPTRPPTTSTVVSGSAETAARRSAGSSQNTSVPASGASTARPAHREASVLPEMDDVELPGGDRRRRRSRRAPRSARPRPRLRVRVHAERLDAERVTNRAPEETELPEGRAARCR